MLRRRGVKRVPCSSGFSWNSSQISDDGVDLTGLEVVLERRHALATVDDENAHDLVVPASRGLVQRRPVGLDAHRRLQVADAARLREDLAAEPLRFVEIALLRLNGGGGRGGRGQPGVGRRAGWGRGEILVGGGLFKKKK